MTNPSPEGRADGRPPARPVSTPRKPWQAPRIVDFGSIRHLVRKGTGDINEGIGGGSGQKVRTH